MCPRVSRVFWTFLQSCASCTVIVLEQRHPGKEFVQVQDFNGLILHQKESPSRTVNQYSEYNDQNYVAPCKQLLSTLKALKFVMSRSCLKKKKLISLDPLGTD